MNKIYSIFDDRIFAKKFDELKIVINFDDARIVKNDGT